jgi:UDP-2-acetamido-2,6-beta-L-arabino-hexul-4-ose reductase
MMAQKQRVLITGANGFIGKNLVIRLRESHQFAVTEYVRGDCFESLVSLIDNTDFIVHLAGVNRPKNEEEFSHVNKGLTEKICDLLSEKKLKIPILFASSTQAELENSYGKSKLAAEQALKSLSLVNGNSVTIFRFPGVFGKWCKPHYNSVVATFCNNISRGVPLEIHNHETQLQLVYIDDVITEIISVLSNYAQGINYSFVKPEYTISIGELAKLIKSFRECRTNLKVQRVGAGFVRALYATYVSCLPENEFCYKLPIHSDPRGVFVEMLKTSDSGQFSYFTAGIGVTRGGHYHHTKTEKFLVIKGKALFRFRDLVTDKFYEVYTSGDVPEIIDTIPGWVHDVTNIGDDEMIVMLWANEIFDHNNPDTIASKIPK